MESPDGAMHGFPVVKVDDPGQPTGKDFFIPKMCNHCEDSPCTQACPYGCRSIHPAKHTAQKCTLCYHRITKGLTTACCFRLPTLRTLVICGGALVIGVGGARFHKPELGWIAYAAIALVTVKLFMQDFRTSTPAGLAVSLVCYGVVLIFGPRWTRQQPTSP